MRLVGKRFSHVALLILLGAAFLHPSAAFANSDTDRNRLTVRESRVTGELEVLIVPNVGYTWQTVSLENTYTNPIPVCTYVLPSVASNPAVVRIRNITGSSFEVKIQEPVDSSAVTASDVHCIVAEEGYHTLSNGQVFEAHTVVSQNTSGSNAQGWANGEDVSSDIVGTYTNPVVLGQVISYNNSDFSVFWSYDCDDRANPPFASGMADGICVGKHIGEVSVGGLVLSRNPENIGYIVIEGDLDGVGGNDPVGTLTTGVTYEVALGGDSIDGVDNAGASYTLNNSGYTLAVASQAAMDGGDGGRAVLFGANPLAGNQIDLAIDEDTLGDLERSHTTENVAYWVFQSDPGLPWMEVINIPNVGSAWQTVSLTNDYTNMVPVCTYNLPSAADNEAVVRIQNIDNGADSFEIRIQRPQNSSSVTASDVHCVVVDEGTHTLLDQRSRQQPHYRSTYRNFHTVQRKQ